MTLRRTTSETIQQNKHILFTLFYINSWFQPGWAEILYLFIPLANITMEKKKTKNGAASSSKHPQWLDSFTNLPTQTKSTSSSQVSDTLFLEIKSYQCWCQFVKLLHNEHLVLIRKQVIKKNPECNNLCWQTILKDNF